MAKAEGWEVEAKVRVEDPALVEDRLRRLGAEYLGSTVEEDIYFNYRERACGDFAESDEALRIRRDDEGCELTYKGPRASPTLKSRLEISVRVSSCDDLVEILERIGFVASARVVKRRKTYWLEGVKVNLDDVEGLGVFVEIEAVGGRGSAERRVVEVARLLGFEPPFITESYLEMLLKGGAK